MQEGLLWFDNNPEHHLTDKINQAAARYKARVGRKATLCYVSLDEYDANNSTIAGVMLKPAVHIRPDYLWIGTDDAVLTEAVSKAA